MLWSGRDIADVNSYKDFPSRRPSIEQDFLDHPLEKVERPERAFVKSKHELLRLLPDHAIETASTSLQPVSVPCASDR